MDEAFIVIVYRHSEVLLGGFLADDVLIEMFFDFSWCWDTRKQWCFLASFTLFLSNNTRTKLDTTGADINLVGAFNHGPDVAFRFATKAAGIWAFA